MTGSFLAELEEIDRHLRKNDRKVLQVPGAGGKLGVRFKPPADDSRLTGVVAALKLQGAIDSDTAKQFLVDCCDEIVRKNPKSGEWEPRDPDNGPLRFDAGDERWGLNGKATARDCVAKLYHLDVQPLAHMGHADVLIDWLQGLDGEIEARLAGESDGGEHS